ncbi:hypothetical protein INT45_008408 [Circinella minor]|uniref:Uncharacterized protein n=1 Tax=Circinella minor TaxID=1195481 RepID=A0A8H7VCS2_9FUNG|nr:hypothetical protein INT45_008408 [Circinella minor]
MEADVKFLEIFFATFFEDVGYQLIAPSCYDELGLNAANMVLWLNKSLNRYIEGVKHELSSILEDDAIHLAERFDSFYGETSFFRSHRGHVLPGSYTLGSATSSSITGSSSHAAVLVGPMPIEVDNTEHFRRKRYGQAKWPFFRKGFEGKSLFSLL